MKLIMPYPQGHPKKIPCVGTKAFIEKEGKLLILHHTHTNNWGIPGGHLEWNEEPEESLKREVQEELGVEIEVLEPILAWNKRIAPDHQMIVIGYRCQLKNPQKEFTLNLEHDDQYRWMSKEEIDQFFPKNDIEYRPTILKFFNRSKQ